MTKDEPGIGLSPLRSPRRWPRVVVIVLMLAGLVVLGADFVHHASRLETWMGTHGWLGRFAFIGAVILFTSVFVPDTVFAVMAGIIFGVVEGTILMVTAACCTAAVNFWLSRVLFRTKVNAALERRPRLKAIQGAVEREGLRLQLLLRLSAVNPVVVNYALGAGNTSLRTYLTACVGLIPTLAAEVYFGHAARHMAGALSGHTEPSAVHTVVTLAGVAVAAAVLIYVGRVTSRALAAYEPS